MPKIVIVDCSTGEQIVREMNAEELATYETIQKEALTDQPTPEEI
jgi:hypothetical protein